MDILKVVTTQENDTFYVKRLNTNKRFDVQLTQNGDVAVISQMSLPLVLFKLTPTFKNIEDYTIIKGYLSDVYGTASFKIDDESYKTLDSGKYTVSVSGETSTGESVGMSGSFSLVITESQLE